MAASNYDEALRRVLAHEGGYTNHPKDPGGPTNFGITIADYRRYVMPTATAADVRCMKLADAKRIYKAKYWDALRCDELPAGVDYSIFDYGVNSGIGRAGKVLRRVCDLPSGDWHVTDEVMAAVRGRDLKALVSAINDERLRFLRSLRTWPVFGKGWGPRVEDVKAISLRMACGTHATEHPLPAPAPGKGGVTVNEKPITQGAPTAGAGLLAAAWEWVNLHPIETALLVALVVGASLFALRALKDWRAKKQEAPSPGLVPVPLTV